MAQRPAPFAVDGKEVAIVTPEGDMAMVSGTTLNETAAKNLRQWIKDNFGATVVALLALLIATAAPAQQTASPCYWQGQLVKCFPTTGIYLDGNRSVRFGETTGNGSNYVEVKAPAALGGDFVMTLPAATDTFVGLATTDVLTNKTLTSPKLNENVAVTTTATKLNYLTSAAGTTGTASTNIVFSTSPSLTTPTIGVATATSVNKVAITPPTSAATLTLIDGSTLATAGAFSTTLTATGATNVTLPTTGTLATLAGSENLTTKTLTSAHVATSLLFNGTSSGTLTMAPGATITDYTLTLPTAVAGTAGSTLTSTTGGVTSWTATLPVANGGTGAATLASNGVLYGNTTSAVQALAVNSSATNKFLTQSSSGAPAWNTIATGDLPITISSGTANINCAEVTNVSLCSDSNTVMYIRIGNNVHVAGEVDIDPGATGNMVVRLDLPIASDLTNAHDLSGSAHGVNGTSTNQEMLIYGNTSLNVAEFYGNATNTASNEFYFSFDYIVK